ncbi:MAG TPA: response regulator [Pyrinomonadaceae bacterium]|nr:response regulator [Pyrinomonadaceae bacterium]
MSTGRRKLLVADDSATVQKVISLTFEDEGVEVLTASDGDEALRALQAGPPPDILLADVLMPGPDGYALCERVKNDPRLRHIPVILLVGKFEPFNEAEARRVGADTVLTKPFQSIRDLVSKVGSLIGGEPKEAGHGEGQEAGRGEEQAGPGAPLASPEESARREHGIARPEAEPAVVEPGRTGFGTGWSGPADAPEVLEVSEAHTAPEPWAERESSPQRDTSPQPEADAPPAASQPHGFDPRRSPDSGTESQGDAREGFGADDASSFADLGVDDEMIEARPVTAFGAPNAHHAPGTSPAASEPFSAGVPQPSSPSPSSSPSLSAAPPHAGSSDLAPHRAAEASLGSPAFERGEQRQAFAARAAAAATADDALLDLGGFGDLGSSEPAAGSAAGSDDFILDLDDEPPYVPVAREAAPPLEAAPFVDLAEAAPSFSHDPDAGHSISDFDEAGPSFTSSSEPAGLDQPSAFAEAAHGEPSDLFEFDSAPFGEAAAHDPAVVREVVAEDVPPRFDSFELRDDPFDFADDAPPTAGRPDTFHSAATQPEEPVGAAPRGFVEPTVVPADEPPRGVLEDEFMDGRVEGDLPKPPAAFAPSAEATTPSTAAADAPAVGQARAGFEETPRAGGLSAEDVDAIARRVVELMSDRVVREIAWEVVPELAELHVRRRLEEERGS